MLHVTCDTEWCLIPLYIYHGKYSRVHCEVIQPCLHFLTEYEGMRLCNSFLGCHQYVCDTQNEFFIIALRKQCSDAAKKFSWRISRLACSFSCTLVLRDCFACWRFAQASCACYNACGTILKYEFSSWIMYPNKQIQHYTRRHFMNFFFQDGIQLYTLIFDNRIM